MNFSPIATIYQLVENELLKISVKQHISNLYPGNFQNFYIDMKGKGGTCN